MVNVSLIQTILREQDNPGSSTTRQIRDLYNIRSGDEPILQHSDEDQEFQSILLKALEELPVADDNDDDDDDDEDKPISYTVKLKDSDDTVTPTMKRRSIIKLPKEAKEQSDSDESSSDTEKPSTASSITITTKPFSPLFLNNMKKFGVSSDWLAKRSNSLRQSSYSRSSLKSNTSKLDAMIKSASTKPIRSNRKLSFIETPPVKPETDKENTDPSEETNEIKKEEEPELEEKEKETKTPSPYDLSSEIEEDKDDEELSPTSKEFSLRIPRVNLLDGENKRLNSSISSDEEAKRQKTKPKRKRRSKKEQPSEDLPKEEDKDEVPIKPKKQRRSKKEQPSEDLPNEEASNVVDQTKKTKKQRRSKKEKASEDLPKEEEGEEESNATDKTEKPKKQRISKKESTPEELPKEKDADYEMKSEDKDDEESTSTDQTKKPSQKKDKNDLEKARIEHLKKLLRISGIRHMIKKSELDELSTNRKRINYLKSLFDTAGFTGNLSIKECEKFRLKRDTEKELMEIQANSVDVKGHVKGGRTLRGQGRNTDEIDFPAKRKRTASSEIEDEDEDEDKEDKTNNSNLSDDEKPVIKKRRVLQMEASPEVSENEL